MSNRTDNFTTYIGLTILMAMVWMSYTIVEDVLEAVEHNNMVLNMVHEEIKYPHKETTNVCTSD